MQPHKNKYSVHVWLKSRPWPPGFHLTHIWEMAVTPARWWHWRWVSALGILLKIRKGIGEWIESLYSYSTSSGSHNLKVGNLMLNILLDVQHSQGKSTATRRRKKFRRRRRGRWCEKSLKVQSITYLSPGGLGVQDKSARVFDTGLLELKFFYIEEYHYHYCNQFECHQTGNY